MLCSFDVFLNFFRGSGVYSCDAESAKTCLAIKIYFSCSDNYWQIVGTETGQEILVLIAVASSVGSGETAQQTRSLARAFSARKHRVGT